jgi:phage terminase large subunit-like protein
VSAARDYAEGVLPPTNQSRTGKLIKQAAERFLSDLQRKDIYWDDEQAVRMINFCERYCYQWEGDWRGKPLQFEPWQRFIFEQVFGWFRTATKTRRITEVYVQVSKKNGKSTMCAGLMNFHLCADDRINTPKVFTAANNEDQAKICVNMAGRIIEQSPDLAELVDEGVIRLFNYKDSITEVVHTEKDGFIKAFAKESGDKKSKTAGGKHGVNASLGVVDEFGMSPDHGASKPIKTSMASRREGLMFYITTAGFDMSGPCYQELRKAGIQVLEGTIVKDNYLPIIFEMDEGDDWKDEKNWQKCAPNLDVSVNRDFLREMVSDAVTYGGTTEVDVKTLNFNMWVDSPSVFISSEDWNKNTHGVDVSSLDGETCYGGLEIGPSGEISALSLLFPGEVNKIKLMFFCSEEAIKKTETYLKHKDLIRIDTGNEVENDVAINWIIEEFQKYNLHSFAFPNTQKNNSIIQGLINAGYTGNPLSQGINGISDPTTEWEKLLRAGEIEHFNNDILRWMNSNCMAIRKETGTRIEKNSKVLGIYASIMALAQWKTIEANEPQTGTECIAL